MAFESRNSIAMILVLLAGYVNLFSLCMPFTKWRSMVASLIGVLTVGLAFISTLLLDDMLGFLPAFEAKNELYILAACTVVFAIAMQFVCKPLEKLFNKAFAKK